LPAGLTYVEDSLATDPAITDASASATGQKLTINLGMVTEKTIIETKNPEFSMLSSVKCRNSQEINDFSTLSDTPFYPLFQSRKYLRCCSHSNPEVYHKSTVRPDNC